MDKRTQDRLKQYASALAADQQTQQITERTASLLLDADRLQQIAQQRSGMAADKAQGWLFEQLEVTKFNLNSLKAGSDLQASTTDSLGRINDETVDVIIRRGQRHIKNFQLKSGNKASSTAHMLSDPKYTDVGLVGPSDQHDKVRELYEKRIETGTLKAGDYKNAHERLHKGVEAEGVSSGGTEYSEALRATDPNEAAKVAGQFKRQGVVTEMHRSGLEAGKIGAAISGGVSGVSGLINLSRGEADVGEVVAQVAVDAAKGYANSYVTTAVSKGVPHLLVKAGMEQSAASLLTKSNAHLAIAAGAVQSGKSIVKYLQGDIDGEQLLSEISHTAMTGASAFYYGALGQAIIPIPVVGAFVGSTVGYFVGNMLHQSGLISLGEAAVVKAARERREHIEALCLTAIPLMRAHRLEIDNLIAQHFADRGRVLSQAFDGLEHSLLDWNADGFTAQLERVNQAFGASLPFKTLTEFDAFMADDDQAFVL